MSLFLFSPHGKLVVSATHQPICPRASREYPTERIWNEDLKLERKKKNQGKNRAKRERRNERKDDIAIGGANLRLFL